MAQAGPEALQDQAMTASAADLAARIATLERQLSVLRAEARRIAIVPPRASPKAPRKAFQFDAYPTRKIALRLAYLGWCHGGLAWTPDTAAKTTVEAELFRALLVARLVRPSPVAPELTAHSDDESWRDSVDMEGWDYSRAGRTDAGVSATGQVVSLWVRSNLVDRRQRAWEVKQGKAPSGSFREPAAPPVGDNPAMAGTSAGSGGQPELDRQSDHEPAAEMPYGTLLNNLLPESVRVIDWSPASPDFDARFSCQHRHYKYFFSRLDGPLDKGLDVEAMRDAAARLVGEHDFRNLCKLDKTKQITNFRRRILSASIDQEDDSDLLVFNLQGTAFLYNQVRNIMAILFLVGSRLEAPSIIDALLCTDAGDAVPAGLQAKHVPVDRKPEFPIASGLPLVLWECGYAPQALRWQNGEASNGISGKHVRGMRAVAQRLSIKAAIAGHQLKTIEGLSNGAPLRGGHHPLGAGEEAGGRVHVPVLERPRQLHYAAANEKWRTGPGARRAERKAFAQAAIVHAVVHTADAGDSAK